MSASTLASARILEKKAVGESPDSFQVFLDPTEDPRQLSPLRRWTAISVVSAASFLVLYASAVPAFAEAAISEEFRVGRVVTVLSISLFVHGLGLGSLVFGPFSELYGRKIVYRVSFALFFLFSFPAEFANNIYVHLIFRFIAGLCGSAALCVAGGSVGDMFTDETMGNALVLFMTASNLGPIFAPIIGGFVTQNLHWRWNFHILQIWTFVQCVAIFLFVPETCVPILEKWKAQRLRKTTGNSGYWAAKEREDNDLLRAVTVACCTPLKLLALDHMALLLSIWAALALGIVYLAFSALPLIFAVGHGFNLQMTGLSFSGIGVGVTIGGLSQPLWNIHHERQVQKYNGNPPPETRLIMGQVGGVFVPLGLFWFAFTTYSHIHWVVPIIASISFGIGIHYILVCELMFFVAAYRPIAASSVAAFNFVRSIFVGASPLFSAQMYARLGVVGATAFLAGLMSIMAPLPFIYFRYGAYLRRTSPYGAS